MKNTYHLIRIVFHFTFIVSLLFALFSACHEASPQEACENYYVACDTFDPSIADYESMEDWLIQCIEELQILNQPSVNTCYAHPSFSCSDFDACGYNL